MASLLETLAQQLGGNRMTEISRQIGADEQTTGKATGAALSTLIAALARNAQSEDGARSLHKAVAKDHDGSVLDNLSGLFSNPQSGSGDGILKHMLGGRRSQVEAGLGKTTGLESKSVGKLLQMLAPVVMGALGKQQRQSNLDTGSLSNLLGQERQQIEQKEPMAAGLMGKLLDADGDGDVDMSDLAKHGAGMLGKLFSR